MVDLSGITVNFYEKETEFFSFTPLSLMDDVLNSINERVYQAADKFQSTLFEECSNEVTPDQIEHGMQQLITLMESCVDKYFTVFEEYIISNVLKVPNDISLPHWKLPELNNAGNGVEAGVEEEWSQIMTLKYKNMKLRYLNETFSHWCNQVNQVSQRLSHFQSLLDRHGVNDLSVRLKAILLDEFPQCISKVEETLKKAAEFL